MRVWIQQRAPSSTDISHGHPTIEQAIKKLREDDDGAWWRHLKGCGE